MKEFKVEAKLERLPEVLAFLDAELDAAECSPKIGMQLDIAAEEIFVNIANYAYTPDVGEAVICVTVTPELAEIIFRDRGVPYNPLAKPDPDVTKPAKQRRIGGLGIFMVKKSMDEMLYAHEDGQNILTMRKRLQG